MKNLIILFAFIPTILMAQDPENVGIGTTQPTEKLEVNGIIFSNSGGIKFPDGTIQTTAYTQMGMMPSGLSGLVVEFDLSSSVTGPANDGAIFIQDGINCLAVSEGASIAVTNSGGGQQISNPFFSDVSISRLSDGNTAQIRKLVVTGTNIPYIEVFYLKMNVQGYVLEQIGRYENCILTSISVSSSGVQPFENISFTFTKACYRSYIFDQNGSPLNTFEDSCYDLAAGTSSCSCSY